MKKIFSIFALAALMLLPSTGLKAQEILDKTDFPSVGSTGHTLVRKGYHSSEPNYSPNTCEVKITKMPSGDTPGTATITKYSFNGYSDPLSCYVSAYFQDKSGRKFVVTKIADNAFQKVNYATSICLQYFDDDVWKNYVKNCNFEIGNGAFSDLPKLIHFNLVVGYNDRWSSCTRIGNNAFKGCSSLKDISVRCTEGGTIGAYAFKDCAVLAYLYLSGSIDETAFEGCTGVTRLYWYGGNATTYTSGMQSPMYPMRSSVEHISIYGAVPAHFFESFSALQEVTSNSKFFDNIKNTNLYQMKIGDHAFAYCYGLKEVQVAGEIHPDAFYSCSSLAKVTYRGGFLAQSQIPTDYDEGFFYSIKDYVTSFTIEETSTNNVPNAFIPSYLCYGMKKLTSVTIPDYVSGIGIGAFKECSGLTTVSINKSTSQLAVIGDYAFQDCSALKNITLPATIESIYDEAVAWCENLTTCPLNEDHINLHYLGHAAFYQAGISGLYIPVNVKKMGDMQLGGSRCKANTIIFMPKNLTRSDIGGSWAELFFSTQDMYKKERNAITTFCINSETSVIPDSICYNFGGLSYVYDHKASKTLSSVTEIGKGSFAKCSSIFQSIQSLFPNLVTIGESAFEDSNFKGLLVKFPKVKTIGAKAFKNSQAYKMSEMGFEDLTTIGDEAFANCSYLADIHIPAKVTKIGTDAFKGSANVATLKYDASGLEQSDPLGEVRTQIAQATIGDDVTLIPEKLLYQSQIEKLTIPYNVEKFGSKSFAECAKLDSVILWSTAEKTTLEESPFDQCSNLQKVIFEGPLTQNIPGYLFANTGVKEAKWGNVMTISTSAFENTMFESLSLPMIDIIGFNAFAGIPSLKSISIIGSVPQIQDNTFNGTENVEVIYGSCSTVDELKASDLWTAVCNNIQATDSKYTKEYLDKLLGNQYGDSWYSYNGKVEVISDVDCEGKVTLKCNPDEGYKWAYWRYTGDLEQEKEFDLSTYQAWFLGGLCYNDANVYQTNFGVEPAEAGVLKLTNQYGHSRNDQKFICINTDREDAYLQPMETNGWYKFKEWKVDGMYSMTPSEIYDQPGVYELMLDIMENPGMGEIDPETGDWIPGESTLELHFDPNMKAVFELKDVDVTVESCTDGNGSVALTDSPNQKVGSTISLTATPKEGFLFDQWSDGNTDATRTVTIEPKLLRERAVVGYDLENDQMIYEEYDVWDGEALRSYNESSTYSLALCASFKADPNYKKKYTIIADSEDPAKGTVSGGGVYEEGSEVTLTATPAAGYDFSEWTDGNTDNPRTVVVTADATYKALFVVHINYFTITTKAEPAEGGEVYGGGKYAENEEITLAAEANTGYEFIQWADGVTEPQRKVKVMKDETYTAQFKKLESSFTITVKANNDEYGSVMGSGTFKENAEVQIAAIPKTGYHFVKWDDDNTDNPRTVKVTKDETYTAIFEADAIPTYTITVQSENEEMGVVMGGGSFKSGEETSIGAIAKEGYEFVQWSDGNTDNPRTITVTKDETYTAQFKVKGEGLDDLNAETMTARKVMINGTIFIRQGDKLFTLQGQEVK